MLDVLKHFLLERAIILAIALPFGIFLALALRSAKNSRAQYTSAGDLVLLPSRPIRLFALLMPAVVIVMIFIFPPKPNDVVPALGCVTLFSFLGGAFHWMLRRLICIAGDRGILMPSIWTRPRFYLWSDISRLEINRGSTVLLFHTTDGRKWDIPRLMTGHPALLDLARQHPPPALITDLGIDAPNVLALSLDPIGYAVKTARAQRRAAKNRPPKSP